MNSITYEDLTHEYFVTEAAKCMRSVFENNQKVTALQKELIEVNLSVVAYIEESKQRLEALRLELAKSAKSTKKVVEILSDKQYTMSESPQVKIHCTNKTNSIKITQDNNNVKNKVQERQLARNFISWYNQMVDNDRQNLVLYLSDDAVLEWFGRTIKTRKKVSMFLIYDMQCTRHDFTTVEGIDKIINNRETVHRKEDSGLANPLLPDVAEIKPGRTSKRRIPISSSPEWADGCGPPKICIDSVEKKKMKYSNDKEYEQKDHITSLVDDCSEINNQGDGIIRKHKRKYIPITPPPRNCELGQGDCIPSTSTDSDKSHDALNAQLTRHTVECNGFIEFTRTKHNSVEGVKWDRKCKVQISYSEDPLNIGEFIIWFLRYSDDTKCRRNLLAAFEEVAADEKKNS